MSTDGSNDCIQLHLRCALCGTLSQDLHLADWPSPSRLGRTARLPVPDGWIRLEATLPDVVISNNLGHAADAIFDAADERPELLGGMAIGLQGMLNEAAEQYKTAIYVCPSCISGNIAPWVEILRRFDRYLHADDSPPGPPAPIDPTGNVRPFPPPKP